MLSIVLGVIVVIILLLIIYLYDINFRQWPVGINEIRGKRGDSSIENFNAPLEYGMGPYSNKKYEYGNILNREIHHGWMHPPQHTPLFESRPNLYAGSPLPLKDSPTETPNYSNGPSVDGTNNTPPAMFMFANNQCKPECCPSTYSCNGGCVCTTSNQRNFINGRGIINK